MQYDSSAKKKAIQLLICPYNLLSAFYEELENKRFLCITEKFVDLSIPSWSISVIFNNLNFRDLILHLIFFLPTNFIPNQLRNKRLTAKQRKPTKNTQITHTETSTNPAKNKNWQYQSMPCCEWEIHYSLWLFVLTWCHGSLEIFTNKYY